MTETFGEILRHSRDVVQPGLRAAVATMDAETAAMAAYHLGWTDSHGRPQRGDGGKGLRPALALLSARAGGGTEAVGIPGAVAVELVHHFSLVHDDVMDRDEERHHRPAVWAVWGDPQAILVGDAMIVAAQRALLESDSTHTGAALALLLDATSRLIGGQAADLDFERRADVSLDECLQMTAGKTGALLSASAAIGAVLAGAESAAVDALAEYGERLGAAFQLVDDLLGIWGDPEVTGKPVLSDLRRGKKSLPVTFALAQPGGATLGALLPTLPQAVEADVERAARLVESTGGRRWATDEAERQAKLAVQALDAVDIPADVSAQLTELAAFVVARNR